MENTMTFWDFYSHYYTDDNPPVIASRTTGDIIRHGGGSTRCNFWAGYDGLVGGIYSNRPNRNTAGGASYAAGRAYRRDVNAGRRPALPDPSPGMTRTGTVSHHGVVS
jgi:hypothetical protein